MTTPQNPSPAPQAGLTQPLILWGSVIAQPNVDSTVPNEQLANPFGLPMELLAMRFRVVPQGGAANSARVTGGGIKIKLDLGPAQMATDIPLSLFGDMRDTYENGNLLYNSPAYTGSELSYPTAYDWRLKYPVFIPAGKVVSAVFTPVGLNPLPVRIDVMYICRTWDMNRPQPRRTKVPWAASFETKAFQFTSAALKDQSVSSNLDVVNPFNAPLELQRIGGRCSALALTGVGGAQQNFIYEDPAEFRTVLSTIRMRSSRGFDLIRTPVPFDGVFPMSWRSWDIVDGWSMAPQEFYRVQVDTSAIPYDVPNAQVAQAQFSVGIVGYRDVEVAAIEGSQP